MATVTSATTVSADADDVLVLQTPPDAAGDERKDGDESKMNSRFGVTCTTDNVLKIEMKMYKKNRASVLAKLRAGGDIPAGCVILMEGGPTPSFYDTDHEPLFRQESNFHYLFGVKEPDFYGTIDVDTGRSVLYCPRLPAEYATWMGEILTPAQFKEMYGVDEVKYADELAESLQDQTARGLLRLKHVNSDSGNDAKPATFEGIEEFTLLDDSRLSTAIIESRVIKSPEEIEVMRYMNTVSSEAHLAVMANCKPGFTEYQMEAIFQHWCYYHGGSRCASYTCICAAGHNGATLHYGHAGAPNSKKIKDGDMCLFDMGGEYHRYGSDITCSFPANGKFTDDQRMIYQAVLDATWAVERAMKPGVQWKDMHGLAYRTILTKLKEGGVLQGEVDDMMEANMGAVFMPHGLGHFLGIDTHDVGGYPEGAKRDPRPGWGSLRANRKLAAGMIITVEPGIYFNDYNVGKAMANPEQAKFINTEALARFTGFGGVRIEDDVLVCDTHAEVLTHVPRTVEDIEAVMAGTITRREDLFKPDYSKK